MKRCPWCREPLDRRDAEAPECPHCGKRLRDDTGRELSALDLRYHLLEADIQRRLLRMLRIGVPVAAVAGFSLPLFHVAVVFVLPAMLLAHMIVLRMYLQGVSRPYFSPARRFVTRWMTRFFFLWIATPAYSLALIPILGGVSTAACFAGVSWAAAAYEKWNLGREKNRMPLSGWERLLLVFFFLSTAIVLLVVFVMAVVLGWSIQALLGFITEPMG